MYKQSSQQSAAGKNQHQSQNSNKTSSSQQAKRYNANNKQLQSAEGTRNIKRVQTSQKQSNNEQEKVVPIVRQNSAQITNNNTQSLQGEFILQGEYSAEGINNLIHEYLLKNGMNKTLDIFQSEMIGQSQPSTQKSDKIGGVNFQQFQADLIKNFESGNRDQFFQKWNKFIPINIRLQDERSNKLEFYLHIYFYIYNIHPFIMVRKHPGITQDSVQFYKSYLESRGKELSKTSEFLQFYALPYIDRPQEHPALKHFFEKQWLTELKQKLKEFLDSLYLSDQAPLLFSIYQKYLKQELDGDRDTDPRNNLLLKEHKKQADQSYSMDQSQMQNEIQQYQAYIAKIEQNNKELLNVVQEFNVKYNNLQSNYRNFSQQSKQNLFDSQNKWRQMAQELVTISNKLMQMIKINQEQGMDFQPKLIEQHSVKLKKYEDFLSKDLEELIQQSQDYSIFDKVSMLEQGDNSMINQPQHQYQSIPKDAYQNKSQIGIEHMDNPYVPLNYDKIKEVLIQNQDPVLSCVILQALKWRITKTKGAYIRREVVIAYITYDLIGCKDIGLQQELLLGDSKVQEFTLRLINSMASDYQGRSYLVEQDDLVKILIHILQNENEDTPVRRNALGALQKLSLRRRPQIVMIENNLIQWIVDTLKDRDNLSEYSNEYATALFMNLSLRSLGKDKCEGPMEEVLQVLNVLLEHENSQVRTFVNGTLYSLLSRQAIREQAKKMGYNEILHYLMENSEERFNKQIQYIIDQLNRDVDDEQNYSDNEEDNDVDDIDDEEDLGEEEETDEFVNAENLLMGEELLIKEFSLSGLDAKKQKQYIQQITEQTINAKNKSMLTASRIDKIDRDMPFNRPQTPMSVSQVSYQNMSNINYNQQQQPYYNPKGNPNQFQRINNNQGGDNQYHYHQQLAKQQLEQQKSINQKYQNQQQGDQSQMDISQDYRYQPPHQQQQQQYIQQQQQQQMGIKGQNSQLQKGQQNNNYQQQQNQELYQEEYDEEEGQYQMINNEDQAYDDEEYEEESQKQNDNEIKQEYFEAFQSVPKIPRTPPLQKGTNQNKQPQQKNG